MCFGWHSLFISSHINEVFFFPLSTSNVPPIDSVNFTSCLYIFFTVFWYSYLLDIYIYFFFLSFSNMPSLKIFSFLFLHITFSPITYFLSPPTQFYNFFSLLNLSPFFLFYFPYSHSIFFPCYSYFFYEILQILLLVVSFDKWTDGVDPLLFYQGWGGWV